jgi:GNAT superfamily N-acetyltransferase
MTQAGFALTGTGSGTSSFVQRRNGLWFPTAFIPCLAAAYWLFTKKWATWTEAIACHANLR